MQIRVVAATRRNVFMTFLAGPTRSKAPMQNLRSPRRPIKGKYDLQTFQSSTEPMTADTKRVLPVQPHRRVRSGAESLIAVTTLMKPAIDTLKFQSDAESVIAATGDQVDVPGNEDVSIRCGIGDRCD